MQSMEAVVVVRVGEVVPKISTKGTWSRRDGGSHEDFHRDAFVKDEKITAPGPWRVHLQSRSSTTRNCRNPALYSRQPLPTEWGFIMRAMGILLGMCLLACAGTASAGAYLRVVSWNTLHAGWSGQTDWNGYARQAWSQFGSTASAANGVDLIFAQEVMYDTAAASMAAALNSTTGYSWDYRVTPAIGRTSYKERYAVFFRTDRVQLLSHSVWTDTGDKFEREPQIVKVRHVQTGADYTFINWHTVFGTTAQRQAEVAQIASVFSSVQSSSSSDQDVILLGDHNRDATSAWWSNLTSVSPAASYRVNELTSINTSCGYASAYDHFWFQSSYVSEYSTSGRDYISNMCVFRDLSDHAPIYLSLYSSADTD